MRKPGAQNAEHPIASCALPSGPELPPIRCAESTAGGTRASAAGHTPRHASGATDPWFVPYRTPAGPQPSGVKSLRAL